MMSGSRMKGPSGPFTWLLLLAAVAFAAGCSTSNTSGGGGTSPNHVLPSGSSVAGWTIPAGISLHASAATNEYISGESPSSCSSCHGSDLSGGVSNTSCFGNPAGCHHGTIPGWVAASPATQNHGVSAKKAPGSSSFFSCQICHGPDFRTIRGGTTCFSCHTRTPHAPKPWRTGAGSLYDHGDTNPANAPVCYTCHAYAVPQNPNNPHQPAVPAPAGTSPGCFNGTMCHNQAGHPAGWVATAPAAQPHGDTAKKDGTVSGQGFPSCQTCHGDNFAGGSANVPCFTCHGVSAPHAPKPWRTSAGTAYTHTTTIEAGNAPVCYTCHAYTGTANPRNPHPPPVPAPAGTQPGCYNGTMCHNQAGHPAPYNLPSHYSVDNAAFAAGCASCHDISGASAKPGPVCVTCHTAGSPLTALTCTSCHGGPGTGGRPTGGPGTYPNIAGAHAKHLALGSIPGGTNVVLCDTCHSGYGTGTLEHYKRAYNYTGAGAVYPPRSEPGDVNFGTGFPYTAKNGGPSAFDNSSLAALTCSAVKCHGGSPLAPAPNWRTGTIDVLASSGCLLCHNSGGTTPTQYIDLTDTVFTEHIRHASGFNIPCTLCHITAQLTPARHFGGLTDNTFPPGAARATIDNVNLGWNPTPPIQKSSCSGGTANTCHQ